ncbi:hypothetical protein D9M71_598940 [compost metagenome]
MEVTALHEVIGQARRRHEPATTLFAIDLALGFELEQCLAHGNPGGTKQLTELAFGWQLAPRSQQPVIELLLKYLANGCHRFCCLIAHQRYLSGLDQHTFGAELLEKTAVSRSCKRRQCR